MRGEYSVGQKSRHSPGPSTLRPRLGRKCSIASPPVRTYIGERPVEITREKVLTIRSTPEPVSVEISHWHPPLWHGSFQLTVAHTARGNEKSAKMCRISMLQRPSQEERKETERRGDTLHSLELPGICAGRMQRKRGAEQMRNGCRNAMWPRAAQANPPRDELSRDAVASWSS